MTQSPTAARRGLVRGIVHSELRTATLNEHASIDKMLLRFDLNRTEDYQMFLNIHFKALVRLRPDWRSRDIEDFAGMLACVKSDLERLGDEISSSPCAAQTSADPSKGLGIAYVIRGSRLGAAVLRRGMVSGFPTSYLDFVPSYSWAAFLLELESVVGDAPARDNATRGARSAFAAFERR